MTEAEEYRALKEFARENKMFEVALKGALSEIRFKAFLESQGHIVTKSENSDNNGTPDFVIQTLDGETLIVEHKRASKYRYKNGDFRVEVQKSRNSGECKSNRLYPEGFCDIVSVDVSEHTGIANDYRYISCEDLERNQEFPDRIKAIQKEDKELWRHTLTENK